MIHPDRRNKSPSHNEIFSDQIIEEVEQAPYKTKRLSYLREFKQLNAKNQNDVHKGFIQIQKQHYKRYDRVAT